MKFCSFDLCSVLTCGIVFISVAADIISDDKALGECVGQYLKDKGKLEFEFNSNRENTFQCSFAIQFALGALRNIVEYQVDREVPNGSRCVLKEFDRLDTWDHIFKMGFIGTTDKIPESERATKLANMKNSTEMMLVGVATACEIDRQKLGAIVEYYFPSESEANTLFTTESS